MAKKIQAVNFGDFLKQSHDNYIPEVVSRIFPHKIDGLKDVGKGIVHALSDKTKATGKEQFPANDLVGQLIANYHDHREDSIWASCVNLFRSRLPLLKIEGDDKNRDKPSFSKTDGSILAKKYASIKITEAGKEFIRYAKYAPKIFNYDGVLQVPAYYPSLIPNILFNTYIGIAVGYSFDVISLNPYEVFCAMQLLVQKPNASTEEIAQCIKGIDLDGDYMAYMNNKSLYDVIEHGHGKVNVIPRWSFKEDGKTLCIYEPLYFSSFAVFQKELTRLKNKNQLKSFNFIDMINTNGVDAYGKPRPQLNIIFYLNEGFSYVDMINELYSKTTLCKKYTVEYCCLVPSIEGDYSSDMLQDIVSVREIMMQHIELGKENRLREIDELLQDLEKRLAFNKLLEKASRPFIIGKVDGSPEDIEADINSEYYGKSVAQACASCLPFSDKRYRWKEIGEKYVKTLQYGTIIVDGGFSEEELNVLSERKSNQIFGQIDEHSRIEIINDIKSFSKEKENLLLEKTEERLNAYIISELERFKNFPNIQRKTQMFYLDREYEDKENAEELSEIFRIQDEIQKRQNALLSKGDKCTIAVYKDDKIRISLKSEILEPENVRQIIDCNTDDYFVYLYSDNDKGYKFTSKINSLVLDEYIKFEPSIYGTYRGCYVLNSSYNKPYDYIFVTTTGRVKRIKVEDLADETNKGFKLYYNEYLFNFVAIERNEIDDYYIDLFTNKTMKSWDIKDMAYRKLDGFRAVYSMMIDFQYIAGFKLRKGEKQDRSVYFIENGVPKSKIYKDIFKRNVSDGVPYSDDASIIDGVIYEKNTGKRVINQVDKYKELEIEDDYIPEIYGQDKTYVDLSNEPIIFIPYSVTPRIINEYCDKMN